MSDRQKSQAQPVDLGPIEATIATVPQVVKPRRARRWGDERVFSELARLERQAIERLGELMETTKGKREEFEVLRVVAVYAKQARMARRVKQSGQGSGPRRRVREDIEARVSRVADRAGADAGEAE